MTNKKIEIKYNNKTYEIEKDVKEQKVRPKGVIFVTGNEETEDNKEITVKNYQESFWNTSAEVDGNKVELEWGKGKKLTAWGVPTIVLAIIGAVAYFYYSKKPITTLVEEVKDKVTKKDEKDKL